MTRELFFDPAQLVRRADEIARSTSVADFPDLRDRLATPEGTVDWSIVGDKGIHGQLRLRLHIKATLLLTCQRCLGPLPWSVDETRVFVIYPDEDSLPDLEDEADDEESLVVQGDVDAWALVSEELLLALPMMALHDTASCHASPEEDEPVKTSPFAALARLKN